jgi:hypothetical protein
MEDLIKKCSFENWYPVLRDETIRAKIIEMPEDFKNYLLHSDFVVTKGIFPELEAKVNDAIEDLNGSTFVKLNFTAPTDSQWIAPNRTLELHSFEDIVYVLKASTRVMLDLSKPFGHDVDIKPIIVLKRYFRYKDNREFRIFMRDRKHFFVSSRDTSIPYHFDKEEVEELCDKMVEAVSRKLHPTKIVIDVYISPKMRPHIIDVAPWSPITNTLLFNWDELEHLDACEVRLSDGISIQPKEDPAVPVEMMDGKSLEEVLKSFKDYEEQLKQVNSQKIPDEFKTEEDSD